MNKYFEYPSPFASELKRLGYALELHPTSQDNLIMNMIFNDVYCDLNADITILRDFQISDCAKSMIRVYAYYINNPQQFNHDPRNIVGYAIRHAYNTALNQLVKIYKKESSHYFHVRVKGKLIKTYTDRVLTSLYPSSKQLADRVKRNTLLQRDADLNLTDRLNFDLLR